jgi:hypothetical protein
MNAHTEETQWRERLLADDIPLVPEVYGEGFPGYISEPPPGSLVNVKFDKETKDLSMNWSFSYGIVTKNAHAAKCECSCNPVPEDLKTIPGALYYTICHKGGITWFAVAEED